VLAATAGVLAAPVGGGPTSIAGAAADPCAAWMDPTDSPSRRANALVGAMTQDQKLHMLTFGNPPWFTYHGVAGHVAAIPELCIPDLVLTDAGSGVAGLQVGTTVFPSGVAQVSTWNPRTQRAIGTAIGKEAFEKGINVMLGPGMNIARTPYNGRTFEYFGEDPFLASRTAVSVIRGIQSNPVIADAKHYAFNNQEVDRMTVDVRVDERTRREIYLPAFEASVKEANVGSVMCSYNKIDTLYACENPELLTDYLRKDWGFDGFVVSDWGAVHSTAPSANAGLDLEMHATEMGAPATPVTGSGGRFFAADQLQRAVDEGEVRQARIDDMVRNIVRAMFEHGLFDQPVAGGALPVVSDVSAQHEALARRAAAESTVMLKNRDDLLPLSQDGGRTIAVIGYAANPYGATNSTSGGGSSHPVVPPAVVSPLQGIQAAAAARGDTVVYAEGSSVLDATAAATLADVVVVVATDTSSEGADRTDLGLKPGVCVTLFCSALPSTQEEMIAAATAANPNTVVVLDIGAPVRMPWLDDAGAVLVPWFGGLQHGNALADVLYGDAEPGGRLPQTFPVDEQQLAFDPAAYPGVDQVETYSEGLLVGYRWYDAMGERPLFPFGFGLGYTDFSFRGLAVRRTPDGARVSFTVTNTGDRAGAAVPQVYVTFPRSAGEPPRQLKGFTKLTLDPGASRRVTIPLDRRAFSWWSTRRDGWVVTPGRYGIAVGSSSRDLPLRGSVTR
jgi:beta-glucosidase